MRAREKETERQRERHQCEREITNWGLNNDLGMCPDQESNPRPFGARDNSPTS